MQLLRQPRLKLLIIWIGPSLWKMQEWVYSSSMQARIYLLGVRDAGGTRCMILHLSQKSLESGALTGRGVRLKMAHKWQLSRAACLWAAQASRPSRSANCIANSWEIYQKYFLVDSECNFRIKGRGMITHVRQSTTFTRYPPLLSVEAYLNPCLSLL